MDDEVVDNLEIAPPEVVLQAAHDFAASLAETPEFKAYEQAAFRLSKDPAANEATEAFLSKQESLKTLIELNAVPAEDTAEFERLRQAYLALPCVIEYQQAEADLRVLCQALAGLLSQQIGFDFAAATSTGCC